ncbi:MAG: flagellar biosynthetic protein FliO [Spirochaetota bacterium]
MHKAALLLLAAVIVCSVPAHAAKASVATNVQATNTAADTPLFLTDLERERSPGVSGYFWMVVRALVTIAIFIGVLYFIFLYLKRRSNQLGHFNTLVKVLGLTLVAPNRYVCVIEVAEEIFLLGVSEHNVSIIKEITEKHAKDAIRMQSSLNPLPGESVPGTPFSEVIATVMEAFKVKRADKKPVDFVNNIRDRIRTLGPKKDE